MTDYKIPYSAIPPTEPQSALSAALEKLNENTSKVAHLEPRHVKALREYITGLEAENRQLIAENVDLEVAAQLVLQQHNDNSTSLASLQDALDTYEQPQLDDAICDEIDKAIRKPINAPQAWARRFKYYSEGDFSELDY